MPKDYFADLKKQPYDLFTAARKYSFDLDEGMIKILKDEFKPDFLVSKVAEAVKGKTGAAIETVAQPVWEELAQKWMRRSVQLGNEYPDRTMEVVLESVDKQGNQFLFFPHIPQRFVEIAYLGILDALKIPIVINNRSELAYNVPKCTVYKAIKEKIGEDTAKMMTCRHFCLKALETLRGDLEIDAVISMPANTAKDGLCTFSMKKV